MQTESEGMEKDIPCKWKSKKSWKSLVFLYTNNEKSEREIKETIPFTIAIKRIKYLGMNLPKEGKNL